MTSPSEKEFTQHFLSITSKADRGVAEVIFNKRPGLKHVFEQAFNIEFPQRTAYGDKIFFSGDAEDAERAQKAFAALSGIYSQGGYIKKDIIWGVASDMMPKDMHNTPVPAPSAAANDFQKVAANQNTLPAGSKGGVFQPKTPGQAEFAKLISESELTFGIGAAGTGKTHVACVMAFQALKEGKIKKVFLARPAKEAGESIGFIPGTAEDKMGPYMRPIYDELDKIFGKKGWQGKMQSGEIEIAPLGFMRGRTFSDAFIILDEAQNTTVEQIRMALTRIGENSKMVVTGDESQVDLDDPDKSGLMYAVNRLEGADGVGIHRFNSNDVVRAKIVKTVVDRLGNENTALKPRVVQPAVVAETPAAETPVSEDPAAKAQPQNPKGNQGCSNKRW
jgi:phosphate starvation-inducible protein PhoH and related proteins